MTLDRDLLGLYLSDHLAGATGGLGRLEQMCEAHRDLPIHADLVRTREQVQEEIDRLREIVDRLGTRPRRLRQATAWAGEKVGRLKLNRRLTRRSPMTPVLELELLRGAVMAKQGLWEVLRDHADALGLDPEEFDRLAGLADEQRERLQTMHQQLSATAFRQG